MNAADCSARVLIGSRSDGAGVQDYDFGRAGIACAFQAAVEQLPLDGCAIGLRCTTAEVFYVIRRHKLIITSVNGGALRDSSRQVYDHIQRMAKLSNQ